jgi:hypothetical protein
MAKNAKILIHSALREGPTYSSRVGGPSRKALHLFEVTTDNDRLASLSVHLCEMTTDNDRFTSLSVWVKRLALLAVSNCRI